MIGEVLELIANMSSVMKLMVAAIYTNYTTSIIDDEGMEQADAFLGHPVGEKLLLKLNPLPRC